MTLSNMMRTSLICFCLILICQFSFAQGFTRADTLRGSITEERAWWDLVYYHLDISVDPNERTIEGSNLVKYKVLKPHNILQIDLQKPLQIDRVEQNNQVLKFTTEAYAHFIQLQDEQIVGEVNELIIYYSGHPREAVRAPWDGGISWKKDEQGQHFIASSCQGLGASVWWPCKDHMSDEVDSMLISVEVPLPLQNISNGRLRKISIDEKKATATSHWFVSNPINNYGVNINIGNYVGWEEIYNGEKGNLDLFYYALEADEKKARKHFEDVPLMLAAFEDWFGPYPFYEDGYKLVQVPYLGMEHQSSVTYGNQFEKGYLGRDLSGTGWGLKFDFIIIHESGHEWFANNITHKDLADMWIHESFTNYSESLFLDYHYGKDAGQEYVRGTRKHIENRKPMIGPYEVNFDSYTSDVYYKGGNVLNTLRTMVNDDEKWKALLRAMNQHFYHQTISSAELESYISEFLDLDLTRFFNQYLRDPRVPTFEYYIKENTLHFRWTNCIEGFNMPLEINLNKDTFSLNANTRWKNIKISEGENSLDIDPNYYIGVLRSL